MDRRKSGGFSKQRLRDHRHTAGQSSQTSAKILPFRRSPASADEFDADNDDGLGSGSGLVLGRGPWLVF